MFNEVARLFITAHSLTYFSKLQEFFLFNSDFLHKEKSSKSDKT